MNEKKIAVPISRRYLAKLSAANARTPSVDIWANTKEAAEISRIPPAAVPGPLISGALWMKRSRNCMLSPFPSFVQSKAAAYL